MEYKGFITFELREYSMSVDAGVQRVTEIMQTMGTNELKAVPLIVRDLQEAGIQADAAVKFLSTLSYCIHLTMNGPESIYSGRDDED